MSRTIHTGNCTGQEITGMMHRVVLALVVLAGCSSHIDPNTIADHASTATWRVASYNIHHGRGMDDRVDLERIAAVLRQLNADVIALQEVDERGKPSR
jgi:hypothetical protein